MLRIRLPKSACPNIALSTLEIPLAADAGGATFQAFDQLRQRQFWRIFNVHMNVVFRDHARKDANIFGIAHLNQQVPTANFDVTLQNMVTILGTPNQMYGQACNGVVTVPIIFHLPLFYIDFSGSTLKSCAESA